MLRRYAELHPTELEQAWAEGAPALLPLGALEWHGPHLPLGLDGLLAESFALRLAKEAAGVLLPCLYAPITPLPHPLSLEVKTSTLQALLDDTLSALHRSGARRVCLVSGHYAQGHEVELYRAAMRAMNRYGGFLVFAASPLEPLGEDRFLDHAARFETSQLLAVRPDLVRLDALDSLDPHWSAVLGDDPRTATAEEGEVLIRRALNAWAKWLGAETRDDLLATYEERIEAYRPYMDKYFKGSWEDALNTWWESKAAGS